MKPWHARLDLDFRSERGRTVLAHRHRGPLQLQKALYPEGPELAHALILHPPSGVAGGDALEIEIAAGAGAHALVTTPGAGKWYKANGQVASQSVRLHVAGALEWLPQEAIVFNQAQVESQIEIDLTEGAATIGWDLVALGRRAAGERFDAGCFSQSIRLRAAGELIWHERTRIEGGDELLDSPVGIDGHTVFGCLWAWGPVWTEAEIDHLRERFLATAPVTRVAPRLVLARVLAPGAQAARMALEAVWTEVRPQVFAQRAAQRPRIWST